MSITANLAFLQNIGWPEYLIIFVILLLLFGRRLPEVGRNLGRGIVEFKKGMKDVGDDVKNAVESEPRKLSSSPDSSVGRTGQKSTVSRADSAE